MKKIYLLGAAFLISLGITGCTPATTATPPASKPASTVEQQEKEVSLTIYRPTEDAMYLVPVTVKMKLKDDPPKAALAAMIADDRKQKYPILPKGLSVNTVEVKDGIATVDFSKELLNMDKSTTTEELFTAMTVNTLTEFPDIKEVKFLMNPRFLLKTFNSIIPLFFDPPRQIALRRFRCHVLPLVVQLFPCGKTYFHFNFPMAEIHFQRHQSISLRLQGILYF